MKTNISFLILLAACTDPVVASDPTESTSQELSYGSSHLDVFVSDNAPGRNAILAFDHGPYGDLHLAGTFPTGGHGTGGGLGSQGAVVRSGRYLFVVNAGSDELSLFEIRDGFLVLRDIIASGGAQPISVTVHEDRVYVLNAGRDATAGNITGFHLAHGALEPIVDSTRLLSAANVAPAQIGFDPSGHVLVVSEKATNLLTTYTLGDDDRPSAPTETPSSGQTPFGFAFDDRGTLIVSEAFGGAPNASAISSYRVDDSGALFPISASVPNGQTAACWIALSERGHFAYTTNTASNNVSGYRVRADGEVIGLPDGGNTATTGAGPIDAQFSNDSRWLYVLDAGAHAIDVITMRADGRLVGRQRLTGIPEGAAGLATR